MTLYLDSSALLKRYVEESDSDVAERYLSSDRVWATARHTWVEVRRNLARLLAGNELAAAQRYFADDFGHTHVVELDEQTCVLGAQIAAMHCIWPLCAASVPTSRCCHLTLDRHKLLAR